MAVEVCPRQKTLKLKTDDKSYPALHRWGRAGPHGPRYKLGVFAGKKEGPKWQECGGKGRGSLRREEVKEGPAKAG